MQAFPPGLIIKLRSFPDFAPDENGVADPKCPSLRLIAIAKDARKKRRGTIKSKRDNQMHEQSNERRGGLVAASVAVATIAIFLVLEFQPRNDTQRRGVGMITTSGVGATVLPAMTTSRSDMDVR